MSTQGEFQLSMAKSWKPSKAIDYPFGDGDTKRPDKRPRRQLRMWSSFGIPARKITASLIGTLSSWKLPKRRKEPGTPALSRRNKTRRE